MTRLKPDGTAEPVSQNQILRLERGQGNIIFRCSADHEQGVGNLIRLIHTLLYVMTMLSHQANMCVQQSRAVNLPAGKKSLTTVLQYLFLPPFYQRVLYSSEDSVGHSTCMSVLARRRAIMGSIVQSKRSCLGLSRCCHVLVTVHAGASQGYVLGIPLYPTGRSST